MRRILGVMMAAAVVALLVGCAAVEKPVVQETSRPATSCQCSVFFSPDGGATEAIVDAISSATKSVLVQAYSFTSRPIAKALLDAKERGVDVRVILDGSTTDHQYSPADFFANSGISTKLDYAHALAHNKVMIIDGETVITGSFNFTKAAETKNAENVLIIHDRTLAARYTANWNAHSSHSRWYRR